MRAILFVTRGDTRGIYSRIELIRPEESQARPVPRGDGLAFIAFGVSGPDPVMRIEYHNPITGEDEHLERAIR